MRILRRLQQPALSLARLQHLRPKDSLDCGHFRILQADGQGPARSRVDGVVDNFPTSKHPKKRLSIAIEGKHYQVEVDVGSVYDAGGEEMIINAHVVDSITTDWPDHNPRSPQAVALPARTSAV